MLRPLTVKNDEKRVTVLRDFGQTKMNRKRSFKSELAKKDLLK